jgi:hypothetical protein
MEKNKIKNIILVAAPILFSVGFGMMSESFGATLVFLSITGTVSTIIYCKT